ncbi:MAG TPA: OmpA family protein [Puia sp.]|nr:OmpA family protein [Puia sp.]
MTKTTIGITGCLIALFTSTHAQRLTIGVDGGLQGSRYTLTGGQTSRLPGGSVSILYAIPLKSGLDLLTGLNVGVYRTQAALPGGSTYTNYQVDDEGSAFVYSVKPTGYKETQRFLAAGIPLLLQYHTPGARIQWYVNAGGKVIFPSGMTTKASAQQLLLSGYYPDYNIQVSDLQQHGFGPVKNWSAGSSAQLKPSAALVAAMGLSFPLTRSTRVYTGIFVEYGLTDLRGKTDSLPLFTYSPAGITGVKSNSVLNTPGAGSMRIFAVGLQVRLGFGSPRAKATVHASAAVHVKAKPKAQPATPAAPINPNYTADSTLSNDEFAILHRPVIFGVIQETTIPEAQRPHLDDIAAILMDHPALRITIVGHICNSSTETEDPKVGLARADAVARYLKDKGIRQNRMEISSINETDPVLPNNPGANFQKRRVVINIK